MKLIDWSLRGLGESSLDENESSVDEIESSVTGDESYVDWNYDIQWMVESFINRSESSAYKTSIG